MFGVGRRRGDLLALAAEHVHQGASLVVWRTKNPTLAEVPRDALPLCSRGAVSAAEVVVSCASRSPGPGILLAVWKKTGGLAWTREVGEAPTIRATRDRIYLKVGRAIECLDAPSGDRLWSLDPGAPSPVSRPTISNGRIYYWTSAPLWSSDTFLVACADARSGSLLWTAARPGCLPHPLLVNDGRVLGSEHEQVFALDQADGRLLWTHGTGRSIPRNLVAGLGGVLVRFQDGIRLLRVDDGEQLADWSWKGRLTRNLVGGPTEIFASRSLPTDVIIGGRHSILAGESEIVQLRTDGSVGWTLETNPFAPRLVWDGSTGILFESLGTGVGLIDPIAGRRRHLITMPEDDALGRPIVENDLLYLANVWGGEIVCVRLPR